MNKHIEDLLDQALKEYEELEQRVNEAIKWLEDNGVYSNKWVYGVDNATYRKADPVELLEILKGDDNE